MLADALVSWLHFLLIFAVLALLVMELVLVSGPLTKEIMVRLGRIDMIYGLAAIALVTVGFGRAMAFAKTWEYYKIQPWFWAKLGLLALMGALSAIPTIHFIRWAREIRKGATPSPDVATVKRLKKVIHAELGLIPLIALAAAFMARAL